MTAGRWNLPHRETVRLEPVRYCRECLVRGTESHAVLRRGQPLVVLRRFRILLGGEKLLKCALLLGSLGKDDVEALRAQRSGRLAGIELRTGKLVDVAGQGMRSAFVTVAPTAARETAAAAGMIRRRNASPKFAVISWLPSTLGSEGALQGQGSSAISRGYSRKTPVSH